MLSPIIKATIKLPSPEKVPLITTISIELLLLIILVQLFSIPQHRHAPKINKEPMLNSNESAPSKDRITLATVTKAMAIHSLLEITSLKTNNAIREVATISKLLIKETFAALEDLIPNIRRMGAIMSRTTIAIV